MNGLVIDLFAGGGGASTGLEWALGRSPDIAVNHDVEAVAMHRANHPETKHLCGSVWDYAPREVTGGKPVAILWCSPTCTHFSKAKGGPLDRKLATKVRGLAWVATRFARDLAPKERPRIILLENVEAFADWGPLTNEGKPCERRRGLTFRRWVKSLRDLGYAVEWRELRACDYGAPTTRKRLFVIARCDGLPIVWPSPTHGIGGLPVRTAASIIDWSLPCPSIFERDKPLADATMRRIARGLVKFVLEAHEPFVVANSDRLAVPSLIHCSNGERPGQAPRIYDLQQPLGTVVAQGQKHGLVYAFLAKHYGGNETPGIDVRGPLSTITTQDHHHLVKVTVGERREEARAFLTKFYGTSTGQELQLPLGTVTAGGWKHGLVMVRGESYAISDIGMRMLTPRELARAQGFDNSHELENVGLSKPLSKSAQVRMIGNSVCPDVAAAIVRANVAQSAVRAA